ncbi:GTP cyclohydrolase II RibA [Acinetobacter seifertii]|uniref:GTP cyclohydrolase II RibA n=1 Tax=Acinetobacter seifertii TaxID=1530123 RepID=UPI0015805949|nr:GTP cyclohydrolase II RibA [Acinetobacter seifertii]NUG13060.1 GTP cyclohydrolase II RibA [Acinetobacter seifertii]
MTQNLEIPTATVRSKVAIVIKNKYPATFITFDGLVDGQEHFAVKFGDTSTIKPLIRIHSECITGDLFGSTRCDCGYQLQEALQKIAEDSGYLIYMRQEGRGIGLYSKLDAYLLQDGGMDTFDANLALSLPEDARSYIAAAQIIQALELNEIRLITNNINKVTALEQYGIHVINQICTGIYCFESNVNYLRAKALKHGHTINLDKLKG